MRTAKKLSPISKGPPVNKTPTTPQESESQSLPFQGSLTQAPIYKVPRNTPCVEVMVVHTKDTMVRDAVTVTDTLGVRSKRPSLANSPADPSGISTSPQTKSIIASGGRSNSPLSNTGSSPTGTAPVSRGLVTVPLQQLMRKALGSLQADSSAKTLYYLPEGNLVVRHTIGIDGYYTNNHQTCVENLYSQRIAPKVRSMFDSESVISSKYGAEGIAAANLLSEGARDTDYQSASHVPNSYMYLKPPKNHDPTSSVGTKDAVVVLGGHTGRRRRNMLFGTTLAEPRPILGPMDIPGINVPPRSTWGILMKTLDEILKGVEEKRFIKDGVLLNGYTVTIQAFKLQGTSIIESLVPVNGITMAHAASPLVTQHDEPSGVSSAAAPGSGSFGATDNKSKPAVPKSIFGVAAEVESRRTSRVSISSASETPQHPNLVPSGTSTRHPSNLPEANSRNATRKSSSPSTAYLPRASSKALDAATTANLRNQYTRLLSIANGAILEAEENPETVPRRFEVPDGIQLDVKTMSDAVHITNCLEGMYNVSNDQSPTRALPFHMLITVKLTGIVKERMQAQTTLDFGDDDKKAAKANKESTPSTLAELYAPLLKKHESEVNVFGGPPKVDLTQATPSEVNAMLRKSIDRKSSMYKKTAKEVQLADDPGMTPLPTRYFHLVELGDLDWTPPEGAQQLPSDALAFQEELSHFAVMLKQLRDLEDARKELKKVDGSSVGGEAAFGEFSEMFSSGFHVHSQSNTLQPSPSVLLGDSNGPAMLDDLSPPPRMQRAQTAISLSAGNNSNSDTFGNNASRLQTIMSDTSIDSPSRRQRKALSLLLVEFSHSLRANNLSRLLFSNLDPTNVSVAFLANATFAKARSLMTYIAVIRNEPIQIALEGPNGVGRENIDEELRKRIFTSQAEAVTQWATGSQLKAKMRDLTTTLSEQNEKYDHLEQRLATLKRLTTNTAATTPGATLSASGNRRVSNATLTPSSSTPSLLNPPQTSSHNNRKLSVASASTTQSGLSGSSPTGNVDQGSNVYSASVSRDRTPPNRHGREFGESQGERDLRHLRLRCQVLKQKFDEGSSDLRKAKIEGAQASMQLKEAVSHYQDAILNNEKELEVLGDAIQHTDNVLFHKQEAANAVLQKEITATMTFYRKTRQLEEELLQVARDRRFVHSQLNKLRSEQQRFYSGENAAPTDAELEQELKEEKKSKRKDGKPSLSKRRVEALATINQIKDYEDQLVDLKLRQSELNNTQYNEADFIDYEDPSFTELYGANESPTSQMGRLNETSPITAPKTDAEIKREKLNKLSESALATVSMYTPDIYTTTFHTEKAVKEISRETAAIQRHLIANEDLAKKVTKALKVEAEDFNRETFDAMSEIKTLLTFLNGFESIDNSEAKEFFRGVCPRTDCHKDGIFVNSILSADDLWVFPEQYSSLAQRLEMLGVDRDAMQSKQPQSVTTPAISTQHEVDEQKKALQKLHANLIQSSVKTHLNRVVLDRCEAWSRFFRQDWYPRVNPAVALTSVPLSNVTISDGKADNPASVTTVTKPKPTGVMYDSKNARQLLKKHDTRRDSVAITQIGTANVSVKSAAAIDITNPFQEFLAAESKRNRSVAAEKGLKVQSEVLASGGVSKRPQSADTRLPTVATESARPQTAATDSSESGSLLRRPKKIQTKDASHKVKRFN